MKLYREKYVKKKNEPEGQILISVPPTINLLMWCSVFIILVFILFSFVGEFTRKEKVQGVLLPEGGVVNVFSRQSGVITRILVQEGDNVKAGQPLYIIGSETNSQFQGGLRSGMKSLLTQNVNSIERQITVNQEIKEQKERELNIEIERLGNKLENIKELYEIKKKQFELMNESQSSFIEADKRKIISKVEFRERSGQLLSLQSQLKELDLQKNEIDFGIKQKKSDIVIFNNQYKLQNEQLMNQITSVKQNIFTNNIMKEFVVTSPIDGLVSAINIYQGVISQETSLLNIEPNGSKLQAIIFVPSRAIGFINKEKEVFLQYESYPYQKFGQYRGVIKEISGSTIPLENIPYFTNAAGYLKNNQPVYVVKINLDNQFVNVYGKNVELRSGINLTASIKVERRKIYEWVLDPFKRLKDSL